jgi:16S rRNA G966 N2-methylase RsmD
MRIIAGEFRGRKLLPPEGEVTRPITDRVKQSLFDVLSPRMENARVYDCFAGTGSMGLECLSRGAEHVTFFETHRSAVDRLKQNIQVLGMRERTTVIGKDLFRWFAQTRQVKPPMDGGIVCEFPTEPGRAAPDRADTARLSNSNSTHYGLVDLIFLDPPYRFLRERPEELQSVARTIASGHLATDGLVVFRHNAADTLALEPLKVMDVRSYGSMTLEFLNLTGP